MKKIKRFFYIIITWIDSYIFMPIRAWYKFRFYGLAIEDNIHNHQIVDYLQKIINDPDVEPVSYAEILIEKQLKEAYEKTVLNNLELIKKEYHGKVPTYEEVRADCAAEIVLEMLSYVWLKETEEDDE